MPPAAAAVARFAADLDSLSPPPAPVGVAVSGGPDSLALLLLAAQARPGQVEAATVDHRLRPESRSEAEWVAALCERLGVSHAILAVEWDEPPAANVQARARNARYSALACWAAERGCRAVATGHHADDQAETLLMRLARGSGVAGLAGARRSRPLAEGVALVRPLLGWRRAELRAIVEEAGIEPLADPSNRDPRYDRSRARALLSEAGWLDPVRVATSASHLADADEALEWMTAGLRSDRLVEDGDGLVVDPHGLPHEVQRRLLADALAQLGGAAPSGPDLARTLQSLRAGKVTTLAGIRLSGGERWRLAPAPPRRRS